MYFFILIKLNFKLSLAAVGSFFKKTFISIFLKATYFFTVLLHKLCNNCFLAMSDVCSLLDVELLAVDSCFLFRLRITFFAALLFRPISGFFLLLFRDT